MHQNFYFSNTLEDFLFKDADVNSKWGMFAVCIGMAALSMLNELLKSSHQICFKPLHESQPTSRSFTERSHILSPLSLPSNARNHSGIWVNDNAKQNRGCQRVCGSILYSSNMVLHFIIMLSVATFNGYFLIAIIVGSALGYFLFGFLNQPSSTATFDRGKGTPRNYGTISEPVHHIPTEPEYGECSGVPDNGVDEPRTVISPCGDETSERRVVHVQVEVYSPSC